MFLIFTETNTVAESVFLGINMIQSAAVETHKQLPISVTLSQTLAYLKTDTIKTVVGTLHPMYYTPKTGTGRCL